MEKICFTTGEQEFYKEKDSLMTLLDMLIAENKSNKEIIIKNIKTLIHLFLNT